MPRRLSYAAAVMGEPLSSRTKAGHTQKQAAALLGVPYRTYQDWDRGVSTIPHNLLKLYRHLAGLERIPFNPRKAK